MAEPDGAQIDAALERGRTMRNHKPCAVWARYDRRSGRVVVELAKGYTFAFPPRLVQGLEDAGEEQLAQVEILGVGHGLHWETLDVNLSVLGLLTGLFGTRTHMARQAGQATSPTKAAAAWANGAKGGRPRRLAQA